MNKSKAMRKHTGSLQYEFTAGLWRYTGSSGWYFLSLPKKLSNEIRINLVAGKEGWGRMKVWASAGNTGWQTAIWYDTKLQTYLLPVKQEIRRKEQLAEGKNVQIVLTI